MFDLFDEIAPGAEASEQEFVSSQREHLKAEVYEAASPVRAVSIPSSPLSYKRVLPVLFGIGAGVVAHSSLPSVFPPLLIFSLLSLYRR